MAVPTVVEPVPMAAPVPTMLEPMPVPVPYAEPVMYAEPLYAEPMFAEPLMAEAIELVPMEYAPVPMAYPEPLAMLPMGPPAYPPGGYAGAPAGPLASDDSHHAGREDPVPIEHLPTIPPNGRKKALVIGLNYKGTRNPLNGCWKDANNIYQYLLSRGFPQSQILVITDEHDRSRCSREGLLHAMHWLSAGAAPGDVLWFSFSGHGTQIAAKDHAEADGMDEVINANPGQIVDNEIFDAICKPLPPGCRLTVLMDCCHSGTGMDLPYTWNITYQTWMRDRYPNTCTADVRMISGCEDSLTSSDLRAGGVLTLAYLQAAQTNPTCGQMYDMVYSDATRHSGTQRPQLSATHALELNHPWDLNHILMDQSGVPNGRHVQPPVGQRHHHHGQARARGGSNRGFHAYGAPIQRGYHGYSAPIQRGGAQTEMVEPGGACTIM